MPTTRTPAIGAALTIEMLATYRDWIIADQRDLEIQDPYNPELLDGDWRPLAQEARTLLEGYQGRVGIHGPFLGLTLTAYDRRVRALVAERLRQALEFGAAIGATHMVIHSPFTFFGSPFVAHGAGSYRAQEISLVHDTLADVLPMAEQAGCTLVIENIFDANPAPLLDLVRSFDSPAVRMSLDTGHAFISHRRGGPPPDQWVREAGPLLAHLHLQDSDGNSDRHWAPGDGSINWYALFEALGELEHQPRLHLELRNQQAIGRAAAWLAAQGFAQ